MIRYPSIGIIALFLLSLFAMLSSNAATEPPPLRVAIVDEGGKEAVPLALMELLVVRLSKEASFSILERQKIAAVLLEQANQLSLADDRTREQLVTAGRLLGADALVLITVEPPSERGIQPIEARVVETVRGIRFGKTTLAWSTDTEAISRQLDSAANELKRRLRRIRNSREKLTVVSVTGFRANELSPEAQRVRRKLEIWLEVWLANQPGIVVAERTTVLPLIDERKLSDTLPAELGEADATIAGNFRLDFSKKQPQVELTLRVIRNDRALGQQRLSNSLDNLAELRQSAGETILELLAVENTPAAFDADGEAKLLAAEAERLLELRRMYTALDRLITAHALDPESRSIQAQMMKAGRAFGVGLNFGGNKFEGSFFPTALLLADVARQALDGIEQGHFPQNRGAAYNSNELLSHIGEYCRVMRQMQFLFRGRQPSELEQVQQEWLRVSIENLFKRYLNVTKSHGSRAYESAIYCGLHYGQFWAKTPQAALEQRRELFELAGELTNPRVQGVGTFTADHRFRLTKNKSWADRDDLRPAYEKNFRELAASDHAAVRAVGQREAANYSLWLLEDRARAMRHYRQFIDIVVEEVIPHHPQLADASHGLWLNLNEKRGYLELTSAEAGQFWSRVINARWSPAFRAPRNSQNWEYRIKGTLLHLEKAGKHRQADQLLQTCIDSLKKAPVDLDRVKISNQWQETLVRLQKLRQGLQERHPELGGERSSLPTLAVECMPCLTIEQAMSRLPSDERIPRRHWNFTGLVETRTGYVASYAVSQGNVRIPNSQESFNQEWAAIARLDKAGKFLSSTVFPEPFIYDYRRSRLTGIVGQVSRPLASTDAGVFLSVPANGLIWFPLDKPAIHFSAKYLEQPKPNGQPVPFEEARQLTPTDGKLYVLSSDNAYHPRIYELDFQQGLTTMLLDAEKLAKGSPLLASYGFLATPGPPGKLHLWAIGNGVRHVGESGYVPVVGELYLMDLKTKSIAQAIPPVRLAHPWIDNCFKHHLGYQTPNGSVATFNPQTLALDWLLADDHEKIPSMSQARLRSHRFEHNVTWLLTSVKRPGAISARERRFHIRGRPDSPIKAASDWLLYRIPSTTPRRLESEKLPPPEDVTHYLIDDQNQALMLTKKAVFRVTMPNE